MANLDLDDRTLGAIYAYMTANIAQAIADKNATLAPADQIADIGIIYDDMVDPSNMAAYPGISIWIEESTDEVASRALIANTAEVRLIISFYGGKRDAYRYCDAITAMFDKDRTLGGKGFYCKVVRRKYYTKAMIEGDMEIQVAEVILQCSQEVKRT